MNYLVSCAYIEIDNYYLCRVLPSKRVWQAFVLIFSLKILSVLQIFLLELTSRILWSYLGKVYSDIYFYCQMESLLATHYSGNLT